MNLNEVDDKQIVDEAEDTLTIIQHMIDSMKMNVNRDGVKALMHSLYHEALTVEL